MYLTYSGSGVRVRRMAPIRRMLVEDPAYRWTFLSKDIYYNIYHSSVEINLPQDS